MKPRFICIEGNIGVGKSTLAKHLAKEFNGLFLPEEFEENPLLPLFYKDNERYAMPVEFSFLLDRFKQLKKWEEKFATHTVVSDYFFEKCLYFAEANLKPEEFKLFRDKYDILSTQVRQPDVLIIIQTSVDNLMGNISKRGRHFEQETSTDYLKKIDQKYALAAAKKHAFRKIIIQLKSIDAAAYAALYDAVKYLLSGNSEETVKILEL